MKLQHIQFAALFLLMLVTGLFWGTWFALGRSTQNFSQEEYIHIGKAIITNVANPMKVLMPLCGLCIIRAIIKYPDKSSYGFYSSVASLVLFVAALVITVGFEVPVDNQVRVWTVQTMPANWQDIRAKWELLHTIRTFDALACFGLLLAGVLASRK